MAQTAPGQGGPATTQLPPLNVETTAKKPKPKARRVERKRLPSPGSAAAAAAPAATPAPAVAAAGAVAPGANPYADPSAPYKVDRSANTRLTEPLLDTPRTVTTVTKEVIEDKGATGVRELARTTPGITLGTGEGGNAFGDRLFIRGYDARNDAYINGIRDSGVPLRETFNTEQVEILKGPSATIGGRGTTGGAVNLVTKQAAEKNFAIGTATVGTDKTKRGTFDINQVVAPSFGFRVNGMWQDAGVAGRDEVFDNRYGGSLAFYWKPFSSLKLTGDYYHLKLDQLPDWGVPWNPWLGGPVTEFGVDRKNYYGYPNRDFQKGQQDVLTTGLEYKFNENVMLTSRLRYGHTLFDYVASAPSRITRVGSNVADWTTTSNPKSRFQTNQMHANQTDLTSKFWTGGAQHTLVAGVEVSREHVTRDGYSGLESEAFGTNPGGGTGITLNLLSPNSGAVPFSGSPTRNGRPVNIDVVSKSAYLLDTIKFTPQWIFTGGVRLDSYSLRYNQVNNNLSMTHLERDDTLFNYNVGLTYKPADNGSIYVAYGTSSNPVGQELDGSGDSYGGITAGSSLLDPEKNTSAELGTKWEFFNRHLLLTAALFRTEKENARETAPGGLVFSTGKYQLQGYEFGIGGKIFDVLSLYGGYVQMHSEVLESRTATEIGKDFANIAHQSFNLLAKYDVNRWLTVGGQATYRSQIYGGSLGALGTTEIPSFWRFDALAEMKLSDKLTLQLQGLNLTDEVYYDAVYRSGPNTTSGNGPFVYIAPGRAAYATLKVKY